MLTRRHIRIKIIQSVYSFSLDNGKKIKDEIIFFNKSIYDTYDLYILILSLFKEVKNHTDEQIKAYKKNKIKKDENYIGLNYLAKNKALEFLNNHVELERQIKKRNFIKWDFTHQICKKVNHNVFKSQKQTPQIVISVYYEIHLCPYSYNGLIKRTSTKNLSFHVRFDFSSKSYWNDKVLYCQCA